MRRAASFFPWLLLVGYIAFDFRSHWLGYPWTRDDVACTKVESR